MTGNDCGCGERREYMTLGEYMALYPSAYAEATEAMTERQKRMFELRFRERLLYLPKDETSETGETLTITENISVDTVTPDEDNPIETTPGGSFFWRYDVSDDAEAPTIAVDGAQYIEPVMGALYVYNVVSDVTISVQAALKTYPVTISVENGTASPASTTIQARGTATITITPNANYELDSANATGATATRDGNTVTLTNPTEAVTVTASCTRIMYNLLVSAFNCTYSPKYTQVAAGGTYAITFVANAGYDLPEIVSVSGAQYSWKQATGVLTVYNPTDTTIVLVRATAKSYSITANITNGTATGANAISTGQTVALTIAANDDYELPDTITVTGATGAWNKTTGTLSISNPTGNVTVTGECNMTKFIIEAGTYKWVDTPILPEDAKISTSVNFNSYSTSFQALSISSASRDGIRYRTTQGGSWITVYKTNWSNDQYKTIVIENTQELDATYARSWWKYVFDSGNLVKQ